LGGGVDRQSAWGRAVDDGQRAVAARGLFEYAVMSDWSTRPLCRRLAARVVFIDPALLWQNAWLESFARKSDGNRRVG
jgi:hypothetical protein